MERIEWTVRKIIECCIKTGLLWKRNSKYKSLALILQKKLRYVCQFMNNQILIKFTLVKAL